MKRKNAELQKGLLLIAHPELRDPNFRRTVVLLCEHGPDGSMGLVLNRPLETRGKPVLENFADLPASDSPVLVGGPVGREQVYVLYQSNLSDVGPIESVRPVVDGIHLVGSLDALRELALSDDKASQHYRIYAGYAGWGSGQLDFEMGLGSWFVAPARADFVFDTPTADVWACVLRSMGGVYSLIATMPEDLSVN